MGLVMLLGNGWMAWGMEEKQHFLNTPYASGMYVDDLISIVTHKLASTHEYSSVLKRNNRMFIM